MFTRKRVFYVATSMLLFWSLICFILPPLPSMASGSTIRISTAEEFLAFAKNAASTTYAGKTIVLTSDIDLAGSPTNQTDFVGRGGSTMFEGTFDGQLHTISGIYIEVDNTNTHENYASGLFGYLGENGVVKNLAVEGTLKAYSNGGGIAGNCFGTILNCSSNMDISGAGSLGGIVGNMRCGTVANCFSIGNVTSTGGSVGGIIGNMVDYNSKTATIANCYNLGQISTVDTAKVTVGDVIGRVGTGNFYVSNLYYNLYLSKLAKGIGYSAVDTITEDACVTPLTDEEMKAAAFTTLLNNNQSSLPALTGHSYAPFVNTEKYPAFSTSYQGFDTLIDPHPFSVIYQGGEGASGIPLRENDMLEKTAFRLPANSFAKAGFLFQGWSDGTTIYQPGDTYLMPAHNVTFTATWKLAPISDSKYTVTYEGGEGATGTPPFDDDKSCGASFRLPSNPFQKENHTFAGWSDGKGTYQPGDTYTMPALNVCFHAVWKQDGLPSVENVTIASCNVKAIQLQWSKLSQADSYLLYRASDLDPEFQLLAATTDCAYEDCNVTEGRTYYYKVFGSMDGILSSQAVRVNALCQLPAVTKAKVTSPGKNSVKLSFSKVSGAKKYNIYYSTKKNSGYKKLTTVTKNKKTIKSSKLKSRKTYYIKIVPVRRFEGIPVVKKVKIR